MRIPTLYTLLSTTYSVQVLGESVIDTLCLIWKMGVIITTLPISTHHCILDSISSEQPLTPPHFMVSGGHTAGTPENNFRIWKMEIITTNSWGCTEDNMSYYIQVLKAVLGTICCLLFWAKYIPMGPQGTWTWHLSLPCQPSPNTPPFVSVPLQTRSLYLPATPPGLVWSLQGPEQLWFSALSNSTHHCILGSMSSEQTLVPTPFMASAGHRAGTPENKWAERCMGQFKESSRNLQRQRSCKIKASWSEDQQIVEKRRVLDSWSREHEAIWWGWQQKNWLFSPKSIT